MKLSFSTRGWQGFSWDEALETAVDMGFAGIEVTEHGIIQLPTRIPAHWKSLTVTGAGPEKKTYKVTNN